MSVSEVKTLQDGLGGRLEGTEPSDVTQTLRVRYRVECSSLADDPVVVWDYFAATTTLPYPGRSYAVGNGTDPEALCVALDVERRNRSQFYYVVATFEPSSSSGGNGGPKGSGVDEQGRETKDPTLFRDEIDVSWTPITEGVEEAIFRGFDPPADAPDFIAPGTKSPIINTATQIIEGIEREDHIKIVRISKYRAWYDSTLFPLFEAETVNTDAVHIFKQKYDFSEKFGPYRGKLVPVPATLGFLNGRMFYRYTLEVHVHPRTWRKVIANIGTAEAFHPGDVLDGVSLSSTDFDAGTDEIVREIVDDDSVPLRAPVRLDAKGKHIKNKGAPTVYLIWSVYPEAPFAGIEW